MDSMKSLDTSLPRSPRRHRPANPPELIQAFKNAALSVTNLYRSAEATEQQSRQVGYQDALDDLLGFLDKENLGLCDGEGWRVRQWATERLDDRIPSTGGNESEEEVSDAVKTTTDARSGQHTITQEPPHEVLKQNASPATKQQISSVETQQSLPLQNKSVLPPSEVFTFRSSLQIPEDSVMRPPDVAAVDLDSTDSSTLAHPSPAYTLNVLPRGSRSARPYRQSSRTPSGRSLGSGTGTKRRVAFAEYFDLSSLDGPGNSKRSRLG